MDLPSDINKKFDKIHEDAERIIDLAQNHLVSDISGEINFTFTFSN